MDDTPGALTGPPGSGLHGIDNPTNGATRRVPPYSIFGRVGLKPIEKPEIPDMLRQEQFSPKIKRTRRSGPGKRA